MLSLVCGLLFAVVFTTTVSAQITIPKPKGDVTFAALKDTAQLASSFYKEIIANLKKGKFGKDAELADVTSITEVWTITNVPGRTESQELIFYKIKDGTEHAFLSKKGSVADAGNGKLKLIYGDSKEADALFGKLKK